MNNNAQMVARKLKRALHGDMTLVNVVKYAVDIGYNVVFFESVNDENLLRFGLSEFAQQTTSFTYYELAKIIFVSDKLLYYEKLHRLIHELGHILLQHIGKGTLCLLDKDKIEAEAETVVYLLLYKKKTININVITVVLIIFFSVLGGYIGYNVYPNIHPNIRPNIPSFVYPTYEEQKQEKTVYVTPSGKKYHKVDCIYTKDKDCIGLSRSEAEKGYSPCRVCKP